MNNRCKFENCACAHTKDDNNVKIEMFETKCLHLKMKLNI